MKKIITTAVVASFLLTGCVPVMIGGAAAGGYMVAKDDRPVNIIASDAGITGSIKGEYIKDEQINARNINVDTTNGVVTLRGTVNNYDESSKAVAIASRQQGVKNVVSQLTVK